MQAIHTETRDDFEIAFYALPEDTAPEDQFDGEHAAEDIAAIREGRCEWFTAKVTASKAGIELGADYLGCCAYLKFSDFVTEDGYYPDMCAAAIAEARTKLAQLCA